MAAHHFSFEVADAVRVDLPYWCAAGREASRVVVRLEIANQCRHARSSLAKLAQRALEESSLAGAGAGDEVQDQHAGRFETAAQPARQLVIFLEDSLPQFNNPRGHGFTSSG